MKAVVESKRMKLPISKKMRENLIMVSVFIGIFLCSIFVVSTVFDGINDFHGFIRNRIDVIKKNDQLIKEGIKNAASKQCTIHIKK